RTADQTALRRHRLDEPAWQGTADEVRFPAPRGHLQGRPLANQVIGYLDRIGKSLAVGIAQPEVRVSVIAHFAELIEIDIPVREMPGIQHGRGGLLARVEAERNHSANVPGAPCRAGTMLQLREITVGPLLAATLPGEL